MLLLLLLFAASGAAALVHQLVWFRVLSVTFGVTAQAAAAVLTSFLVGLAVGSAAGGRLADRLSSRKSLWIAFGLTEIGIGVSALALLGFLPMLDTFGGALLGVAGPATLMGTTTPLAIRLLPDRSRVGLLLGANNAGAVTGVIAAGLWMIPALGIGRAGRFAAAVNVLAGCGALMAASRARLASTPIVPSQAGGGSPPVPRGLVRHTLLAAGAVSGFSTFALEVIWVRALSAVLLRPTVYAFAVVLAAVLAGLAIGGTIASRLMRRPERWLVSLAIANTGAAACAAASPYLLAAALSGAPWPAMLAAATAGIFLTSGFLGLALPLATERRLSSDAPNVGRGVGALLAVNIAGGIAGAVITSFLLIPQLGTAGSLTVVIAILTAAGIGVAVISGARLATRTAGFAAAITLLAAAMPNLNDAAMAVRYPGDTLLWRREGAQATVAVHAGADGTRTLWINGISQANDSADALQFHRALAGLPLHLHGSAHRYLSIGLGAGTTAGAAAQWPGLAVDVAELSADVLEAGRFFTHASASVLERPNVHVFMGDARRLLRETAAAYDVISADAVVPTHGGGAILNSEEYFQEVQRSLRQDGVFAQWLGPTGTSAWKLIVRTFLRVFPDATLWSERILIAGLGPSTAGARARGVPPELGEWTAGPDQLRAFVGDGPILTDDRPRVEYFLSLPKNDPPIDLRQLKHQ